MSVLFVTTKAKCAFLRDRRDSDLDSDLVFRNRNHPLQIVVNASVNGVLQLIGFFLRYLSDNFTNFSIEKQGCF